ncbi:MAG: hypothetical protein OXB88_10005 [Bacteriovoracales bacterium]|nr:hypothetical protein [Bacteriovoracales bacterium]
MDDRGILQGHNKRERTFIKRGGDMPLAIFEASDRQALFPSEQWFYYWKSSAGLWESQLSQSTDPLVCVPIHWAFHCEDGEFADFGYSPETDLARLASLCESLDKDILFFLPLTPLPIFPAGGAPPLVAKVPAIDLNGMAHAYMDLDGKVNCFTSFFDQRVFESFRRYVFGLEDYFQRENVSASVVGLVGGGLEDNGEERSFMDYWEDSSKAFKRGLHRFIRQNGAPESSREREEETKHLYGQMIRDLYLETAKEALEDRFLGPLEFSFLGGAPGDLLLRADSSFGDSVSHARNITLSLLHDRIPSAALLPSHSRSPGLMGFLSLVVTPDLIKSRLREFVSEDEWVSEYETLDFFILCEHWPRYSKGRPSWDDIGLKEYLKKSYPGQYRIVHSPDKMGKKAPRESVHYLFGRTMDKALMNEMLGAFLEGLSFVLDTSGMDKELLRRLEGFILENSLEVEFIRCHTQVRRVSLGTAMMILFDGNRLCGLKESMLETFWDKLTSVFECPRQNLQGDGGVEVVWMKRMPVQTELNFEEIRRIVLYNPSLREKRVALAPHKKFRFLKYTRDYQATVTSISGGVDIELGADGHVALDFGFVG